MTSYNGQPITYDKMGNPTQWKANKLTWTNGRYLSSFTDQNNKVSNYYYDDCGNRIKKSVAGTVSQFYYHGNEIVTMKTGTDVIHFTYDQIGNLFSMKLNNVNYYYLHNVQNDVIGLVDSAGNKVVSYQYDSWGRILSVTDSTTTKAGSKNPFRYREYYWDDESQLYFLNTRYYDPEVGRFLNPDDIGVIEIGEVGYNDKNLYAYCDNNPIMRVDVNGEFWNYILGIAIGTTISAGYEIISQVVNNGGFKNINMKSVGIAALSGAVGGALASSGLGYLGESIGGAVTNLASYGVNKFIAKESITVEGVLTSVAVGGISGAVGGPGTRYAGGLKGNSYGKALKIQSRYAATGDPSYNGITQAIKNARPWVTKNGTMSTLKAGAVSFGASIWKTVKKTVYKVAKKVNKWFHKIFG